jgi:hypothetical protein
MRGAKALAEAGSFDGLAGSLASSELGALFAPPPAPGR